MILELRIKADNREQFINQLQLMIDEVKKPIVDSNAYIIEGDEELDYSWLDTDDIYYELAGKNPRCVKPQNYWSQQ